VIAIVIAIVIADVTRPIIGADFLAYYGLLCGILDSSINAVGVRVPNIKTIAGITRNWHNIPKLQDPQVDTRMSTAFISVRHMQRYQASYTQIY